MKFLIKLLCLSLVSSYAIAFEITGWRAQSSEKLVGISGETISQPSFDASNWYQRFDDPKSTHTTAVAAYSGYPDNLYYGRNLENLDSSLFNSSWWFRASFQAQKATSSSSSSVTRAIFKGINYRADIFLNGIKLASKKDIVGAFRWFEIDVTQYLQPSNANVLALCITKPINSVFNESTTDLGITFVDWDPEPPDSSMGIWQPVEITTTNSQVSVEFPILNTEIDTSGNALVTIGAVITNWGKISSISGTFSVNIEAVGTVSQRVSLQNSESKNIIFNPSDYPLLKIQNPRLWWPWQMGSQEFYNVTFSFTLDDQTTSDSLTKPIGLREVTDKIDEKGHRLYFVNKQPILIRGAGWTPDLFLRTSAERQETELRYVRDMNLNTVRMEGKFEHESTFYDIADKLGLLIMQGWCCCDSWQHWAKWGPEQHFIANESLRTQIRRLRSHSSVFVFLYGSDYHPTPDVENESLEMFKEEFWPNPTLSSASHRSSTVSGPSGVKMLDIKSKERKNILTKLI